jgi:hypothetical protein
MRSRPADENLAELGVKRDSGEFFSISALRHHSRLVIKTGDPEISAERKIT